MKSGFLTCSIPFGRAAVVLCDCTIITHNITIKALYLGGGTITQHFCRIYPSVSLRKSTLYRAIIYFLRKIHFPAENKINNAYVIVPRAKVGKFSGIARFSINFVKNKGYGTGNQIFG